MSIEQFPRHEPNLTTQETNHVEVYDWANEVVQNEIAQPLGDHTELVRPVVTTGFEESAGVIQNRIDNARHTVDRIRSNNANLTPEEKQQKLVRGFDAMAKEHNDYMRANGGRSWFDDQAASNERKKGRIPEEL